MPRKAHRTSTRRFKDAWVFIASGLLTVFTVFVLLDTFAIGRVQQVAQAADLSSIEAAQENAAASGDTAAGSANSADAAESNAESSRSSSASDTGSSASSSGGTSTHRHKGPHGSGSSSQTHGKSSGSASGSGKGGSSSASSSNAESDTIEVGAASVAAAGESIGSYSDENMQIQVSKVRAYDTDIYVADIQVTSAEYLKTAFAQNAFGRNLKDTTSNMASENGAVLAINGDYYGFRDDGYVVRNGVLYRDTASSGTDALVIYGDGSMGAASQDEASAQELVDSGAWQVLSFGPVLVSDGKLAVSAGDEVDQSMGSNPRTAIGMISPLHYIVVVSDGRTGDNDGLSLYQLAQVLADNGATFAYNLDGGGSTTMYFKGEVINNPTSGNRSGERSVSDIVYFG